MHKIWIIYTIEAIILLPLITGNPPIPDGLYRIIDEANDGYLTATNRPGLPHAVITDEWKTSPSQEWQVISETHDGIILQIIRNKNIMDNEVTDAIEEEENEGGKEYLIETDWNMIPIPNKEGYFELNDGFGCLKSQGKGKRVILESECEENKPSQHWRFDSITEVNPPANNAKEEIVVVNF